MEQQQPSKVKTWSREFAFLMWCGLGWIIYNDQVEMAGILVWPITIFTLASFGMRQPSVGDWMRGRSSFTANGGWSQRGSQRPSWTNEYPDYRDNGEYSYPRHRETEGPSRDYRPVTPRYY